MNSSETHDPIDKLLREQDSYLADDGFTKRVISALPRRQSVLPRILLLAVVIAGAALAVFLMPWKSLPPLDYTKVFADPAILSAWLPFIVVVVVLTSAARAAMRREN